jgi:histidyl-tRNA synthetase
MVAHISGFPEFLPSHQILFEQWKSLIGSHFQSYGFCPLETPVVERLETLLAKGDDHEIYGLYRLGEALEGRNFIPLDVHGGLGLRFDLTVPLARYVAQHHGQLVFPFRRFHIAPVWRGERPQDGRYRQFYQCDIDVIGRGTLSHLYDSEVIAIMCKLLDSLQLGSYKVRLNHRGVLLSWCQQAGIQEAHAAIRLVDKKGKIPLETILEGLSALGAQTSSLSFIEQWAPCEQGVSVDALTALDWGPAYHEAIQELSQVYEALLLWGVPDSCLHLDPLLARGLSYYTGTTCEISLDNHPSLGAICSGGRYGHLAQSFSKHTFPGVGMSLGLSRVFSAFMDRASQKMTLAPVLITRQDPSQFAYYARIDQALRAKGAFVETYLGTESLGNQLKYAHKKGVDYVIVANAEEAGQSIFQIKTMSTGDQKAWPFEQGIHHLLLSLGLEKS